MKNDRPSRRWKEEEEEDAAVFLLCIYTYLFPPLMAAHLSSVCVFVMWRPGLKMREKKMRKKEKIALSATDGTEQKRQ